MVALGSSLAKSAVAAVGAKEVLEQITTAAGGASVSDGIKAEFTIETKSPEAAGQVSKAIKDLMSMGVPPPFDTLIPLQVTMKGKLVTLKGEVNGAALEKIIKAIP